MPLEIASLSIPHIETKPNKRSFGRKIPRLTPEPTELAYVATPYSNQFDIPLDCHDRYMQAVKACSILSRGYVTYSPIVQAHPLQVEMKLPGGIDYWWSRDRLILERCDIVIAVMFHGFTTSNGCQREVEYARVLRKKIWFVTPHELGIKE